MTATGYIILADGFAHIDKDPEAKLPYTWDWRKWLASLGETAISSAVVTSDPGITQIVFPDLSVPGFVSQVFSGGTPGTSYTVTCHISSSPTGYEDDFTIVLDVKER